MLFSIKLNWSKNFKIKLNLKKSFVSVLPSPAPPCLSSWTPSVSSPWAAALSSQTPSWPQTRQKRGWGGGNDQIFHVELTADKLGRSSFKQHQGKGIVVKADSSSWFLYSHMELNGISILHWGWIKTNLSCRKQKRKGRVSSTRIIAAEFNDRLAFWRRRWFLGLLRMYSTIIFHPKVME